MSFEVAFSQPTGGKAGRGKSKTSTVQVREVALQGAGFLLRKSFRYVVGDAASKKDALHKAERLAVQLEALEYADELKK